jgi:thymidylate synthase
MLVSHDQEYLKLVEYVLQNGTRKPNRTGVDTLSVFGYQMRFDLRDGTIPMLTTKKMHERSIIHEILWYLQGSDNIKYLQDNGVTIWDEWADRDGNLGPVYGFQWRKWQQYTQVPAHAEGYEWVPDTLRVSYVDQIADIVNRLKTNPLDRRMVVSAWNVGELDHMALPPCHYAFQLYAKPLSLQERLYTMTQLYHIPNDAPLNEVEQILDENNTPKYDLSLLVNQRSCDVGLGVPFNIVQYGLLLRMFCEVANMHPGELIWNGGDVHIYTNHINELKQQLERAPYHSPTFRFAREVDSMDDFKYDDFVIENYQYHPAIRMEVAV